MVWIGREFKDHNFPVMIFLSKPPVMSRDTFPKTGFLKAAFNLDLKHFLSELRHLVPFQSLKDFEIATRSKGYKARFKGDACPSEIDETSCNIQGNSAKTRQVLRQLA